MSFKKLITTTLTGTALALGGIGAASASLVYDSGVDQTGSGFGTTYNLLTLHLPGGAGDISATETGMSYWDGSASQISGANAVGPIGVKSGTFTFGTLSFTSAGEIALVWNPAETVAPNATPPGEWNEVYQLTMNIYNPAGSVIFTDSLSAPMLFETVENPGTGGRGFVFVLDGSGIATLNGYLAGLSDASRDALRIGLFSTARYVDDGEDTWTLAKIDAPVVRVPVPGTLAVLGAGLMALFGVTRRRKAK